MDGQTGSVGGGCAGGGVGREGVRMVGRRGRSDLVQGGVGRHGVQTSVRVPVLWEVEGGGAHSMTNRRGVVHTYAQQSTLSCPICDTKNSTTFTLVSSLVRGRKIATAFQRRDEGGGYTNSGPKLTRTLPPM